MWNELVEPDFELHLPHRYRSRDAVWKLNVAALLAIDATPARWRARHPTHWLISTQVRTNRLWKNRNRSARGHLRRQVAEDLPSALTRLPRSQGSEAEAAAARRRRGR